MVEYRLSPAAEYELEDIWLYTYHQWSEEQANHYIDMLTAAFVELAGAPMIATACDHIRPGYRRYHVGRHVIYFRITPYDIAIIRILHDYGSFASSVDGRAEAYGLGGRDGGVKQL
jgi:toxin ParE1/3/4